MPQPTSRALHLDQALEQYDSKFRFVLLASTRAEQLVRGARPKVEAAARSTRARRWRSSRAASCRGPTARRRRPRAGRGCRGRRRRGYRLDVESADGGAARAPRRRRRHRRVKAAELGAAPARGRLRGALRAHPRRGVVRRAARARGVSRPPRLRRGVPRTGRWPRTPEEAHITAGEWAEVLVVAPATAHLLARLALGLADDFLTTAALASPRPAAAGAGDARPHVGAPGAARPRRRRCARAAFASSARWSGRSPPARWRWAAWRSRREIVAAVLDVLDAGDRAASRGGGRFAGAGCACW